MLEGDLGFELERDFYGHLKVNFDFLIRIRYVLPIFIDYCQKNVNLIFYKEDI